MSSNPHGLRVLVVDGEPFSDASATGITLCNLFADFPRDTLAQLYTADFPVRNDICGAYFKLSTTNLVAQRPGAAPGRKPQSHYTWLGRAKSVARRALTPVLDSLAYKLSPELIDGLKQFDPSLVYTLGGSMRQLQLALDVAGAVQVPLAIHFMDDWPSTLYNSPFLKPMRRRLNSLALLAIRRASARLVISEAMAAEYRVRYGGEFIPFMNCVDRANVKTPPTDPPANDRIKTICYFGGLHLGRWKCVLEIAEAIQHSKTREEFEIHLYCREGDVVAHSAAFAQYPFVRFFPSVPPGSVADVMQSASALLHVESFLPQHRAYTRLSISTKIPEYLAASRPVLAYGPPEVASIRYLQENASAIVITETSLQAIQNGLKQMQDRDLTRLVLRNAFELVTKNHVSDTERQRFRNVLSKAACK